MKTKHKNKIRQRQLPLRYSRHRDHHEIAAAVADIADRAGIFPAAVSRFPELLIATPYDIDDVTDIVVTEAEHINRKAVAALIEQYGANKPKVLVEYVDPR